LRLVARVDGWAESLSEQPEEGIGRSRFAFPNCYDPPTQIFEQSAVSHITLDVTC
jgi:hypothetical protein